MRKAFLSFTLLFISFNVLLFGQSPQNVWISIENVSINRAGTKPVLSLSCKTFLYDPENGLALHEIPGLTDTLKILDQKDKPILQKTFIGTINNVDISSLKENRKYRYNVSLNATNYHVVNADQATGTFSFRRNYYRNAFFDDLKNIWRFLGKYIWDPYLSNGALGAVFGIVFIALILVLLSNTIAFLFRLFYRVKRISDLPRLFPKNKETHIGFNLREFVRYISFRNYGDKLDFVRNLNNPLEKKNLDKNYKINEIINEAKKEEKNYFSIIIEKIFRLYGTYKDKWYQEKYFFHRYDQILADVYEELKGQKYENQAFYKPLFTLEAFWVIGAVAPLVGLLGTVIGISEAFNSLRLSAQPVADIPSQLAHSIYLAMYTTIWGLIIGVKSILWYYYFKGQIESYLREVDRIISNLMEKLR